jgi:hypothetical protein
MKHTSTYSGVGWFAHSHSWRAFLKYRGKFAVIGYFKDQEVAAWATDFAKYLCHGLKPGLWHGKVGKPNGPPRIRLDYPRVLIIQKLLDLRLLTPDELTERLEQFDAVAI